MHDPSLSSKTPPIPPTHPAIKVLAALMGLAVLLFFCWPYLKSLVETPPSAPERGSQRDRHRGGRSGRGHGAVDKPFQGIDADATITQGLLPIRRQESRQPASETMSPPRFCPGNAVRWTQMTARQTSSLPDRRTRQKTCRPSRAGALFPAAGYARFHQS